MSTIEIELNDILTNIRKDLVASVDEKTKISFPRFFKEEIKYYGVKSALVGKISTKHIRAINNLRKKDVFGICENLFKSLYCEESWIASSFVYSRHKEYETSDFDLFYNWIDKYVTNWATCDTFCNHSVGAFIERYPEFTSKLKEMTRSSNRWVKRAAAVSLIVPAKKGMFLNDIFDIADSLLLDKDDMVQKGYGWMLKEASRLHQKEVFDYVMRNKKIMPRTSLRYAIEKMPEDMRKNAMER